jgi:hypothetical protein
MCLDKVPRGCGIENLLHIKAKFLHFDAVTHDKL